MEIQPWELPPKVRLCLVESGSRNYNLENMPQCSVPLRANFDVIEIYVPNSMDQKTKQYG